MAAHRHAGGDRVQERAGDVQDDDRERAGDHDARAALDCAERAQHGAGDEAGRKPGGEEPHQRLSVSVGESLQRQGLGDPRAGGQGADVAQQVEPAHAGHHDGEQRHGAGDDPLCPEGSHRRTVGRAAKRRLSGVGA